MPPLPLLVLLLPRKRWLALGGKRFYSLSVIRRQIRQDRKSVV